MGEIVIAPVPLKFEDLDEQTKDLAGALIPALAIYEYSFPKEWIELSKGINWDSLGYSTNIPNEILSQSSNCPMIGTNVLEIDTSPVYWEKFARHNNSSDSCDFGTIFKGKKNKNGEYTIYFFRANHPFPVQKIYLYNDNKMIEMTSPNRPIAHLRIEEN